MRTKTGFINLSQPHLPNRGASLQLVDAGRPLLKTQALHAFGDSA